MNSASCIALKFFLLKACLGGSSQKVEGYPPVNDLSSGRQVDSPLHLRFCLRRSRAIAYNAYPKIPQLSAKNPFLNNIIKVSTFQLSKIFFSSNQTTFERTIPSNPAFPAAHGFGTLLQSISFIPRHSFHFQPFLLVASRTQYFSEPHPHDVRFISRLCRFRACFQNMNAVSPRIFRFQPIFSLLPARLKAFLRTTSSRRALRFQSFSSHYKSGGISATAGFKALRERDSLVLSQTPSPRVWSFL